MHDLLLRLNELFCSTLQQPDLVISPATSPSDIPAWGSLNHVRLIAAIEKKFDVHFSFEELMDMNTVGDILRILELKGIG